MSSFLPYLAAFAVLSIFAGFIVGRMIGRSSGFNDMLDDQHEQFRKGPE